jgi:DNA sulfur modification protein DndE
LRLNKLYVSQQVTDRLKVLQSRTGLTPNILCRIGFSLSLKEGHAPNPEDYDQNGKEFNRFTLTGEYDSLFVALLKQRLPTWTLNPTNNLEELFRANINRGVLILDKKCKCLADLPRLI